MLKRSLRYAHQAFGAGVVLWYFMIGVFLPGNPGSVSQPQATIF
jgi:hypothetical protein